MKNINIHFLPIFLILVSVFFYVSIRFWYVSMTHAPAETGQSAGAIPIIAFSAFLWLLCLCGIPRGIHLVSLLWFLLMPIVNGLSHGISSGYVLPLLWPILFEMSYLFCRHGEQTVRIFRLFFVVVAIIGVVLFAIARMERDISGQTNTIFFALLTMPWLLLFQEKKMQLIYMLFFTVLIILSLKRSSLLVLVLYWAFYGITLLKSNRNKLLALSMVVAIVFMGMYAYAFADEAMGGALNERVNREETDEGRNRLGIYEVTMAMIQSSPFHKLMMGHGHFAVREESPLNISAHNDFLEVIYDYGLVAFVLYLCLWYYVLKRCVLLYKLDSMLFFPYSVTVSIFLVMSMVSHLILYNSYFLYMVMFWGAIEGLKESEDATEYFKVDDEDFETSEEYEDFGKVNQLL